jgi:hypothetical protein
MREIIQEDPKRIKIGIDETNAFEKKKEVSVFSEKISNCLTKAHDLFCQTAVPVAVVKDVTYPQFQTIYLGQGKNEPRTPLNDIMTKEAAYFLFAMTLGPCVSTQISNLFSEGDYLLGHLFDLVCSTGIEAFADDITNRYFTREVSMETLSNSEVMLRYSPGYCGWHITAQKMIHENLQSSDIGITLTEALYMKPMKSISGVIIGCNPSRHNFNNDYTFCGNCRTMTCRKRLVVNGIQNNKGVKIWNRY